MMIWKKGYHLRDAASILTLESTRERDAHSNCSATPYPILLFAVVSARTAPLSRCLNPLASAYNRSLAGHSHSMRLRNLSILPDQDTE